MLWEEHWLIEKLDSYIELFQVRVETVLQLYAMSDTSSFKKHYALLHILSGFTFIHRSILIVHSPPFSGCPLSALCLLVLGWAGWPHLITLVLANMPESTLYTMSWRALKFWWSTSKPVSTSQLWSLHSGAWWSGVLPPRPSTEHKPPPPSIATVNCLVHCLDEKQHAY